MLWVLWWIGAIFVPFYQWPASSETSCFINWGLLCAGAVGIERIQGTDAKPNMLISLWLGLLFLTQAIAFNSLVWTQWTEIWALIAVMGNTLILAVLVASANIPVLDAVKQCLPVALLTILTLNLVAWWVNERGFAVYWTHSFNNGGLFSSTKVWAAWCLLSLPIVTKRFGLLGLIITISGLMLAQSSSAWLALMGMIAWNYRMSKKMLLGLFMVMNGCVIPAF